MSLTDALNFDFLIIIKIFVLAFLVLYVIFALVIVRQVKLMVDTLDVGFETPVRIASLIHLALAISVTFFAFSVL